MALDVDLEREQDIEELRKIARAQQAQIQQLLDVVARKSREIEKLRGKPGDLQLTLKMLEVLQQKAKVMDAAVAKADAAQRERAEKAAKAAKAQPTPRGPTAQPLLPVIERKFVLDDADRACPSCGGDLRPMVDQFEESEMIDVIDGPLRTRPGQAAEVHVPVR